MLATVVEHLVTGETMQMTTTSEQRLKYVFCSCLYLLRMFYGNFFRNAWLSISCAKLNFVMLIGRPQPHNTYIVLSCLDFIFSFAVEHYVCVSDLLWCSLGFE